MSPIVAVLYPGTMGFSLGERLVAVGGFTVWSDLSKRSKATRDRAAQAGIEDVSLERIVQESSLILSVLPPSEALNLAKEVLSLVKPGNSPLFVDANAIAPSTLTTISSLISPHLPFLSASIIGGPASSTYLPTLYASSSPANKPHLDSFFALNDKGLKVKIVEGPEESAKALKMGYAGLGKGLTGLAMAMVLSTHAYSPSTSAALLEELALSNPNMLKVVSGSILGALPKAYRWVGEMEEIATFVESASEPTPDASTSSSPREMAEIYRGMAATFERVARDIEKGEEGGKDVATLSEWSAKGKQRLLEVADQSKGEEETKKA